MRLQLRLNFSGPPRSACAVGLRWELGSACASPAENTQGLRKLCRPALVETNQGARALQLHVDLMMFAVRWRYAAPKSPLGWADMILFQECLSAVAHARFGN